MYKVVKKKSSPAKDLIAFKAIARRTYMRGCTKTTTAGYKYYYCARQIGKELWVFKNESAFTSDCDDLNLLQIIKLDNDTPLTNDEIYAIALTAI
jgi:hypothetical protein|nr:MAG TPA: hypothetical protein [Caudoviricetes sp.]